MYPSFEQNATSKTLAPSRQGKPMRLVTADRTNRNSAKALSRSCVG